MGNGKEMGRVESKWPANLSRSQSSSPPRARIEEVEFKSIEMLLRLYSYRPLHSLLEDDHGTSWVIVQS